MSYDLEVAAPGEPGRAQIEELAAARRLEALTVDGPHPAEPEDFAEAVAAACLAPRWLVTLSIPYASPKRAIAQARALARELAELYDGAAFDPQQDALIWPRGRRARVAPRTREEKTSIVELEWEVAPERGLAAAETLLRLLRRRCPEALPTRYGRWEPPPHRYDPAAPEEFARFAAEHDDAFWYARRPSFGGSARASTLSLEFDGNVLESDVRWREAVVELFAAVAAELGAVQAKAEVEPGWRVGRSNRPWISAGLVIKAAQRPDGPGWLNWFGGPRRELAAELTERPSRTRTSRLRRSRSVTPQVVTRPEGVLVRLGDEPRPIRPA